MQSFLASKIFTHTDQQHFAALSGDVNPMHMDPLAARRTQVGAPIVHGMHTLLWSLESLALQPDAPEGLKAVQIRFSRPTYVGDMATVSVTKQSTTEIGLKVEVNGTTSATLRLTIGEQRGGAARPTGETLHEPGLPREMKLVDLWSQAGTVRYAATQDEFAVAFPAAAKMVGVGRLRGLAALSRLVGMDCPGLHSIFSSLKVSFSSMTADDGVDFSVTSVNERFRFLKMKVSGSGLVGEVEAFTRVPPIAQLTMSEVSRDVRPGEFAGQRALVIGGSRGLGELAAKIIATGGGETILTYSVGKADAEDIQRQIRVAGRRCEVLHYDVTQPAAAQIALLEQLPTHVYYFATDQIMSRRNELFEPDIFLKFSNFYLTGFYAIAAAITKRSINDLTIFFPSSVFLDEYPQEFSEYIMAKAAGEVMCEQMSRHMPNVRAIARRLPRVLTDQTASVVQADTASALEALLPLVRDLHTGTVELQDVTK